MSVSIQNHDERTENPDPQKAKAGNDVSVFADDSRFAPDFHARARIIGGARKWNWRFGFPETGGIP